MRLLWTSIGLFVENLSHWINQPVFGLHLGLRIGKHRTATRHIASLFINQAYTG